MWFKKAIDTAHSRGTPSLPSCTAITACRSPPRRPAEGPVACLKPKKKMAWTCHGRSQSELVYKLQRAGIVQSPDVAAALKAVDRGFFVGSQAAYVDAPQPIGYGATISAPHMHATCLELLRDHAVPGHMALDVGSGTGYLTAALAYMMGPTGRAIGVEHIPELVSCSRQCLDAIPWAHSLMATGALQITQGDGRLGYPTAGPYDCIHVGAAAPEIPRALARQLKPGGRMVVPLGQPDGAQSLAVVDKGADGKLRAQAVMGVQYIPLTDRDLQG